VIYTTTVSRAQDVTIGGILHIGTLEARAEAVHPGDTSQGRGSASTEVFDATVDGVAVTVGPQGLMVEDQPVTSAAVGIARDVSLALASRRMTIEPLPMPGVTRDANSGEVEASTAGFRVVLTDLAGERVEMILGRAQARAAATRAQAEIQPPTPVVTPPEVPLPRVAGAPSPVASAAPVPAAASLPSAAPLPRALPTEEPAPPAPAVMPPAEVRRAARAIPRSPAPISLPLEVYLVVLAFVSVGAVFALGADGKS
jgi:hypothetical protein